MAYTKAMNFVHCPQITITSMLAPSPDWFVGIHNYSLFIDGDFIDSVSIDLPLYDAGSDNGLQYASSNEASNPLDPIEKVSSQPQDTSFIDGVPVVGAFTLEQVPLQ